MPKATLAVFMGLSEDPNGKCLGLRAIVEKLAKKYDLDLIFGSHKQSDDDADAFVAVHDAHDKVVILTGHSLGAGQMHVVANRRVVRGQRVDALGLWEPVPEEDALNGGYKFSTIPNVPIQQCIKVDAPFPIGWGRQYKDNSLNLKLKSRGLAPIFRNHSSMCKSTEVSNWYETTVEALCGNNGG